MVHVRHCHCARALLHGRATFEPFHSLQLARVLRWDRASRRSFRSKLARRLTATLAECGSCMRAPRRYAAKSCVALVMSRPPFEEIPACSAFSLRTRVLQAYFFAPLCSERRGCVHLHLRQESQRSAHRSRPELPPEAENASTSQCASVNLLLAPLLTSGDVRQLHRRRGAQHDDPHRDRACETRSTQRRRFKTATAGHVAGTASDHRQPAASLCSHSVRSRRCRG